MNEVNIQTISIKTEPADEDESLKTYAKYPRNVKLEETDIFTDVPIKTEQNEETSASPAPEPNLKSSQSNNVVWIKSETNQIEDDTELSTDKTFKKCEICQKCFKSRASLKIHMRTHTGERPYTCNVCGNSFTQGNNLKKHMLKHTEDCEECKKEPDNSTKAPCTHIKDEVHKCTICDKSFSQVYHLKRHMVSHTGEKNHK